MAGKRETGSPEGKGGIVIASHTVHLVGDSQELAVAVEVSLLCIIGFSLKSEHVFARECFEVGNLFRMVLKRMDCFVDEVGAIRRNLGVQHVTHKDGFSRQRKSTGAMMRVFRTDFGDELLKREDADFRKDVGERIA